jgi:integrase
MPRKVNRLPGIKLTAAGNWQARVFHANGEESKNFQRQDDARAWQMSLKIDLDRCPAGITRSKREWHAALLAPTGVISKSFEQLDEAIDWFKDGNDQIRKGTWIDPDRLGETLSAYSATWLKNKIEISGKTVATYRSQLNVHILPTLGESSLTSITNSDVRGWLSELIDDEVGNTTLRQTLRLIRAIFESAVNSGLCTHNPTKGISIAKQARKKAKALTPEQVKALAAACGKYGHLVEVLAATGLRVNEALALQVGDIDMIGKKINVVRTWTMTDSGKKVLGSTKSREDRSIALSDQMVRTLDPLVSGKNKDDFVFIGSNGAALDYGYFRRAYFAKAAESLGIEDVTIHWLRHTCASMLIRLGAPITTISEILGHSSIKITLDTYSHWYEGDSATWLQKLGTSLTNPDA